MLEFDEETTRLLEIVYQGADITRRRQASFDALKPLAAETIVDIGCGNGLLTLELGRAVGPNGRVIGVDPSEEMRKPARARCRDLSWIEVVDGLAHDLPCKDNSADKAASVQVFEYLENVPGAVAEAHRVLKPDGRLVIGDLHLGSLVWFSEDPDRMERMVRAWDHHFAERGLPALLPPIMREAGFAIEDVRPFTHCDYTLKPDGLATMMMQLMSRFAIANDHLSAEEATVWMEEQKTLAEQGRFFFSVTHFVVVGRKRGNQ